MPAGCRIEIRRIAAGDQNIPGKTFRRVIAAGRGELDDLAPKVIGPAVNGIDLVGAAALILVK